MPIIINPINRKSVDVRVAPLTDGIAGRTRDSTVDDMVMYVDPLVPEAMYPTLVIHEFCELKRLLNGNTWQTAHRGATETEHKWALRFGADWAAYNRNYLKLLRKVESRNKNIKDPPDLFRGEEGDKVPVERPDAEKGADVADVVSLSPIGGQNPKKPHRSFDNKITSITKITRDENGRCHDDNGYLTSCGDSPDAPSNTPSTERKPSENRDTGPSQPRETPEPKKETPRKLGYEERAAIDAYVEQGVAYDLNSNLRSGEKLTPDQEHVVRYIDRAMENSVIDHSVVCYRGFASPDLSQNFETLKGTVIEDPAFVSASKNREVAERFLHRAKNQNQEPILAEIRLPAGSHGIDVENVVQNYTTRSEKEILLPRNTKFKVTRTQELKLPGSSTLKKVTLQPVVSTA